MNKWEINNFEIYRQIEWVQKIFFKEENDYAPGVNSNIYRQRLHKFLLNPYGEKKPKNMIFFFQSAAKRSQ